MQYKAKLIIDRANYITEKALFNSVAARISDKQLLIQTWQEAGMNLTENQIQVFMKLPSPETITRCRRKLQGAGKYLPPQQIQEERKEKAEVFKQEMMNL